MNSVYSMYSDYPMDNWPAYSSEGLMSCGPTGAPHGHLPLSVLSSLSVPPGHLSSGHGGCLHPSLAQSPHHTQHAFQQAWYHLKSKAFLQKYSSQHVLHPNTIARRNERERNRVKNINQTFSKLRNHLPCSTKSKKLSKVQILKSAIQYIKQLQQILDSQDQESNMDSSESGRKEKRDADLLGSNLKARISDLQNAFDNADSESYDEHSPCSETTDRSPSECSHEDDSSQVDSLEELVDWLT